MQFRNMSKNSNGTFSNWLSSRNETENVNSDSKEDEEESFSLLGQVQSIQDSLTSQMQELSGSLPEAGPLSAGFRKRIKYAIYLLCASIIFAALAFIIGIPTIVLRPSKFVLCLTLSTILAAASVIVMQKPQNFWSNVVNAGFTKSLPIIFLLCSSLLTIYLTIFIHKYIIVLSAAGIQVCSVIWNLASFIPGGTRGLYLLSKTGYIVIGTILKPFIFICKKTFKTILGHLFS